MNSPAGTETLFGIDVDAVSMEEALHRCAERVFGAKDDREPSHVVFVDPHTLMLAETRPDYAEAVAQAWLRLPDGLGLVLGSRWLGSGQIRTCVKGPDFLEAFLGRLSARGGRPARTGFLGTTEATLERIRSAMAARFPGVTVASTVAPPFRDRFDARESARLTEVVRASGVEVLWVGMTAPKQEVWVWRNLARLRGVRVVFSVGAAFDYFAGTRFRAPRLLRRLGLESHFRAITQPGGGGRRLLNSYRFAWRLFREGNCARVPAGGGRGGLEG